MLAAANSLLAVYGNNTQPGKGSNVYDAIEPIEVSDEYREACHKMRDRRVYHPKETVDIDTGQMGRSYNLHIAAQLSLHALLSSGLTTAI